MYFHPVKKSLSILIYLIEIDKIKKISPFLTRNDYSSFKVDLFAIEEIDIEGNNDNFTDIILPGCFRSSPEAVLLQCS